MVKVQADYIKLEGKGEIRLRDKWCIIFSFAYGARSLGAEREGSTVWVRFAEDDAIVKDTVWKFQTNQPLPMADSRMFIHAIDQFNSILRETPLQ